MQDPGPAAERTTATAAGVWDWLLGGRHHVAADREAAINSQRSFPLASRVAKYNREFLHRAVRYLTGVGVDQFLDIGSGYPVAASVHEVAPGSRVVYVDYEQDTVDVSRRILAGNPHATSVHGDLRAPEGILANPEVTGMLDFGRPVALLLLSVLHFIPDELEPARLVRSYLEPLAPGSHLVISHGAEPADERSRRLQNEWTRVYNHSVTEQFHRRTAAEVGEFFAGTTLVPPGLVLAQDWHPADPAYIPDEEDESRQVLLGGVGRVG
ncbi:SAM-dependent methyltransferase [Amycolatopsis sp. GM8]|uniref:SAM-dependent methyltransferase n=1 Tax=Amycolatopsis sp. GM8 TaxID=2896530 RepID=UPI001F3C0CEE|nr:SAM-dependent methyltransferase [Amycolatopsis sp. GM8]